ncbi:MAG: hypothetical protein L0Z70_03065, partial [Chloroflexi bacterium]|nr:hypothetical protein [Chloroflexota bacterium]
MLSPAAPSLYSPEGLENARKLLHEFVVEGARPQEVRRKYRGEVASGVRRWKVAPLPTSLWTSMFPPCAW